MSESVSDEIEARPKEGADTSDAHSRARDENPTEVFGAIGEPLSGVEGQASEAGATHGDAADEWERAFRGAGSDASFTAAGLPRRTRGAQLARGLASVRGDARTGSEAATRGEDHRDTVSDWFGLASDSDDDSTIVIPRITDEDQHPGDWDSHAGFDQAGTDDDGHQDGHRVDWTDHADQPEQVAQDESAGQAEQFDGGWEDAIQESDDRTAPGQDAEPVQDTAEPESDEPPAERTELIPAYRDDEQPEAGRRTEKEPQPEAEHQGEAEHEPEPGHQGEAEHQSEAEHEPEAGHQGEADVEHKPEDQADAEPPGVAGADVGADGEAEPDTAVTDDRSGARDVAAAGKAGATMSALHVDDEPAPAEQESHAEPRAQTSAEAESQSQAEAPAEGESQSESEAPAEGESQSQTEAAPEALPRRQPARRGGGASGESPEAPGEATEVIKAYRDDEPADQETRPIDRRQLSAKLAGSPAKKARQTAPKVRRENKQNKENRETGEKKAVASTSGSAPASSSSTVKRWLLVIALLLLAAIAAAVAVFFQGKAEAAALAYPANNLALVDKEQTATLNSQVRDAIQAIFSYDSAQLASSEKRGLSYIVPGSEYLGEFQQTYAQIRGYAAKGRITLQSAVADSGVERLSDNSGKVLLMVNQVGRPGVNAPPVKLSTRLSVTAEKVGGIWKVSKVETD